MFKGDKIQALQAELDILVEQILTAQDLNKLKDVTAKNFPDMARDLKVANSRGLKNTEEEFARKGCKT